MNKSTLAREVQASVDRLDQEHLNAQNEKVLALITGFDDDVSESEFGTSFDHSDDDSTFHPPTAQPNLEELLEENSVSQKPTEVKASTSKKAEKKRTHVTTLKLSTFKSGTARVKKPTDSAAIMLENLAIFKRQVEATQNNQFELTNTNVRYLAERLERYGDNYDRNSNRMLKMLAIMRTDLETIVNFRKFNTPFYI